MQNNMHCSRVVYIRTCVCMAGFSKSGVEIGAYSYIILALSNLKENISFTVTETALSMTRLQILDQSSSRWPPLQRFQRLLFIWGNKEVHQTSSFVLSEKKIAIWGIVSSLLVFLLLSRFLRKVSWPEAQLMKVKQERNRINHASSPSAVTLALRSKRQQLFPGKYASWGATISSYQTTQICSPLPTPILLPVYLLPPIRECVKTKEKINTNFHLHCMFHDIYTDRPRQAVTVCRCHLFTVTISNQLR